MQRRDDRRRRTLLLLTHASGYATVSLGIKLDTSLIPPTEKTTGSWFLLFRIS